MIDVQLRRYFFKGRRPTEFPVLAPCCRSRTAALRQANGGHVAPRSGYSGNFSLRTSSVNLGSSRRLLNIWSCRINISAASRLS
jgi:hypothetical protein